MSSVQLIVAALVLLHPELHKNTRALFAEIIAKEARRSHYRALELVALVEHESHFHYTVIGGTDNQCVGWGQVCLHNFDVCKNGFDTSECNAKKAHLQNPAENMRVAVDDLERWRTLCKQKTGRADFAAILHGYGGFDSPSKGVVCGQTKTKHGWKLSPMPTAVKEILKIHRRLQRTHH
jgi:hypothetical protein